jgi:predicted amidophosphoribosyltransferase
MTTAASAQRRIERELKIVRVMIGMYCRHQHAGGRELCEECRALWDYARQRVDRCPLLPEKPTCLHCTVHCYKPAMRERIRVVMRYAGPRMALRHPILSVFHFLDGRRSSSSG